MNTQRKISLAILGVAIVALLVDRVVLSGSASTPDAAEGAAAVEAAQAELAVDNSALTRVERTLAGLDDSLMTLRQGSDLAERLEQLALRQSPEEAAADPFQLPASWRQPERVEPEQQPQESAPDAGAVFQREHRLQAILRLNDGAGLAIVNDQPVRVGQRIGDFVLTAVGDNQANFEREGRRVTLRLERSGVLGTSPEQAAESADSDSPE